MSQCKLKLLTLFQLVMIMKIKLEINPVYRPQLMNYQDRINVFYGGAGSGKSHFVVQKILLKALTSKRKVLVIRKVGNTLRDSIYALFKSVAQSEFGLTEEQIKARSSLLSITLPNGSEIIFKGLDDPEKIKSIAGIDDIVIEEATELTLDDFSQLNLRLRSNNGYNQIHLMFNPVSKANWVYNYWFNPKKKRDLASTMILHTTWEDNKKLPTSYIEELLKMRDSNFTYYKIYALGEFATLDKLIYTNWDIQSFDWQVVLREKPYRKTYFGLDFGYTNDPSAFIALVLDNKTKEMWIFDTHYKTMMTNDKIAQMIQYKGFAKERITADSAEQKSIEEIKRAGVPRIRPAKKGPDSVNNGIQFIQQYTLHVHPKLEELITELENYTWRKDKKTGEYYNEPIDDFNHLLDALRYAVEDARVPKVIKATNSI